MELEFEKDRETKNTIKYAEVTKRERPVVGSLYILKSELGDLGDKLKVTIENK
jgi:hypothetical protein